MTTATERMLMVGLLLWQAGVLSAAEPDRKDAFGDPLPPGAIARLGTNAFRVNGQAGPLDLAPDGQSYAQVVGNDIDLCSTRTGKLLRRWASPDGEIRRDTCHSLRFSADGRTLLANIGNSLTTFDIADGKESSVPSKQPSDRQRTRPSSLSNDGKRITSGIQEPFGKMFVEVADVALQKVVFTATLEDLVLCDVALSGDGKRLATWGRAQTRDLQVAQVLRVWDVESGKELHKLVHQDLLVGGAAFAPDGRHLAVIAGSRLILWDLQTGKMLRQFLAGSNGPTQVCYSADGKNVVVADNVGVVRIWNVGSGERRICRGPCAALPSIRCLSNGTIMALCRDGASVCLWNMESGKVLTPQEIPRYPIDHLAFSRDGRSLISSAKDGVRWWDVPNPANPRLNPGGRSRQHFLAQRFTDWPNVEIPPALVLPNDGVLWPSVNGVDVIDPKTGQLSRVFPGIPYSPVLPSADGKIVVTQGWVREGQDRSQRLLVWDVESGRLRWNLPAPMEDACEVLLSTNRQALAVVTNRSSWEDRFLRFGLVERSPKGVSLPGEKPKETKVVVWDLATGKEKARRSFGRSLFRAVGLSPDGRLIAYQDCETNKPTMWDLEQNLALQTFDSAADLHFRSLTFSPDGRLLVGIPWISQQLIVWEVVWGKVRHDWVTNEFNANTLAFTADGQQLAVGGANGSILLYDLFGLPAPGQPGKKLSAEQLEKLWSELQLANAGRASQAMTALLQAPEQTVALFQERIKPADGNTAQDKEIANLVKSLDDDDFKVRERASKALGSIVRLARPALFRALADTPSAEKKRRLEDLLAQLAEAPAPPALMRWHRALEVLERLATPSARELLKVLASGHPGQELTSEARAALQRLALTGP